MAYLSIASRCPLLAQGSRASLASLSQQRCGTETGKCAESLTALYSTCYSRKVKVFFLTKDVASCSSERYDTEE